MKIVNGELLDPAGQLTGVQTLLLRDGIIAAVGADADAAPADQILDAAGRLVTPGFIDLSCNLREPGNGQKGSIATETRAAARGGFTTVCAAPDTAPVNDSGAVTSLILDIAAQQSPVRVLPLGAATRGLEGELLSDMAGLVAAGCVALSNGQSAMRNARILRRCMAYAKTFDITLILQPENAALAADGFAHDGLVAARLGLLGIPEVAETTAVMEMLLLAEETGVRLHLAQLSSARSVDMVAAARQRGVAVTADVAMHQLVFTEDALAGFDSAFHVRPPLRTENDRQRLLAGVTDGTIDAIVSQHQPHDPAAKHAPLGATAAGMATLEVLLAMGLRLVQADELSRASLLRALTQGPAQVLGLAAGRLAPGAPADLCVLDAEQRWRADADTLVSAGANNPWHGRELQGRVVTTLVGGQLAYQV
ncbi:MAG: dihydroorotase [Marinobacter sp.]|nr:dihydroorotase [Marinobacter sp.]